MGRLITATGFAVLSLLIILGMEVRAQGQPDGQLAIAFDVSIAPSFLHDAFPRAKAPAAVR